MRPHSPHKGGGRAALPGDGPRSLFYGCGSLNPSLPATRGARGARTAGRAGAAGERLASGRG